MKFLGLELDGSHTSNPTFRALCRNYPASEPATFFSVSFLNLAGSSRLFLSLFRAIGQESQGVKGREDFKLVGPERQIISQLKP